MWIVMRYNFVRVVQKPSSTPLHVDESRRRVFITVVERQPFELSPLCVPPPLPLSHPFSLHQSFIFIVVIILDQKQKRNKCSRDVGHQPFQRRQGRQP